MRILLVGVDCVGKDTLGKFLTEKWNYSYIYFIWEVEKRSGEYIEAINSKYLTNQAFRNDAKHIFSSIMNDYKDNLVIAMPSSGLFREYYSILKNHPDVITVWVKDYAKNIMKRLTFYDEESKLIPDYDYESHYDYYYDDVKKDIEYYRATHKKAKIHFNINGMNAKDAGEALAACIMEYVNETSNTVQEQE